MVSNDFFADITGVDHVRSFGIVRDHAADFLSAGVDADYAADGGAGVAGWVVLEDGTVG